MNGLSADGAALAGDLAARMGNDSAAHGFDILICPPFTLIATAARAAGQSGLLVGAQDCHTAEKGAHTGDTSAAMLADLGCSHVILGHSERRADHEETDDMVRAKAEAAWQAGLTAIICVGETLEERKAERTLDVVGAQVAGSLPEGANATNTVIAYEPVWAIGTGLTATPDEAQAVHAFIRTQLAEHIPEESDGMRILYGGSMKPGNATELLALVDVDGGLIGGAALVADDFWSIAQSCA